MSGNFMKKMQSQKIFGKNFENRFYLLDFVSANFYIKHSEDVSNYPSAKCKFVPFSEIKKICKVGKEDSQKFPSSNQYGFYVQTMRFTCCVCCQTEEYRHMFMDAFQVIINCNNSLSQIDMRQQKKEGIAIYDIKYEPKP